MNCPEEANAKKDREEDYRKRERESSPIHPKLRAGVRGATGATRPLSPGRPPQGASLPRRQAAKKAGAGLLGQLLPAADRGAAPSPGEV